jgi:hypothetical protein
MPLSDFQNDIMQRLSANRSEHSYLAGGAALHIEPNSKRYSNALDYFHDSEERVASAFALDKAHLDEMGYDVTVLMNQPGFVRAVIKKDHASTKLEWAHDSAWRFMPVIKSDRAGYILHPVDLAINKLLALVGRDEIRDYVDIHDVIATTLPLGALCWAAAGKDPGFTPAMLIDLLRRRGKYQPEDLKRLDLVGSLDLHDLKVAWLDALQEATAFINSCNPDEIGCLYYSKENETFIQPGPGDDVVPHYGGPGGVLPLVR